MRAFLSRLLNTAKSPALKGELEQATLRLEQARKQNRKLERQLQSREQQLGQAKQRNKKLRARLDRIKRQLEAENAGRQPEQPTRRSVLYNMPKGSVCAEIGVHEGDFSRKVLDTVEPERLHLIDPWQHEEEDRYQQAWYGGLGPEGQAVMDWRYHRVIERFDREIQAGRVRVHRSYSDAASEEFEDSYFDWIYIDGNHLYEFVKKDLELYYPKVKTDGFIAGDDYGAHNWWENGVQKAVDEFVSQSPGLALEVTGKQFLIRKGA